LAFDAKAFLKTLPSSPGIYQMFSKTSEVLYVGKARNLKQRVTSYFGKQPAHSKTAALVKQINHIDVIVTQTENEALLLENTLIKKLKPRYNILFRDDKSYPYIFISDHADYPRLDFHRGTKHEKGQYFGPFPSATAVRETLSLLQKIFKIRQCQDPFFRSRSRPCLQYYIKRCTAPCVGFIQPAAYLQDVKNAKLFLAGKNKQVITDLAKQMEKAANDLEFERASHYRDQITHLRHVQERQHVYQEGGDTDVIAAIHRQGMTCVEVLFIRGGHLLGHKAYFPNVSLPWGEDEILSRFIEQYYLSSAIHKEIPRQIIVNSAVPDRAWLESVLSEQVKHPVSILHKVRGSRAAWLQMALRNAEQAVKTHLADKAHMYDRFAALQTALNLDVMPTRLECFDISHTLGEATVGSCVVFDSQGPLKSDYRRFNITGITPGDDYAALRDALSRRYTHVKETDGKLPDILFIDGGKGQLHQAENVLTELQVSGVLLVGISKGPARKAGLELLHLVGQAHPISLPSDSLALHLIQQIRDEAHRFAITAHRERRGKARTHSRLENIPGVGAKRRRELLRHFGGLQEVRAASVAALAEVPGISQALAEKIHAALNE
jgi:excinuclease ABC subunit C